MGRILNDKYRRCCRHAGTDVAFSLKNEKRKRKALSRDVPIRERFQRYTNAPCATFAKVHPHAHAGRGNIEMLFIGDQLNGAYMSPLRGPSFRILRNVYEKRFLEIEMRLRCLLSTPHGKNV